MADSLARKDEAAFAESFSSGLRMVLGISVPASIGLLLLGEPVVELLRFGRFEGADAKTVAGLVGVYGCGLPFYSAATFATRGLHASKAIPCTVRVSAICLLVNLVGSLILMHFLAERGLALANVIAAMVQTILLWRALAHRHNSIRLATLRSTGIKDPGLNRNHGCLLSRRLITPEYRQPCRKTARNHRRCHTHSRKHRDLFLHPLHPRF